VQTHSSARAPLIISALVLVVSFAYFLSERHTRSRADEAFAAQYMMPLDDVLRVKDANDGVFPYTMFDELMKGHKEKRSGGLDFKDWRADCKQLVLELVGPGLHA
jgi:hypothetical protein